MLPFFIRLKVQKGEERGINLYLPMFILYILLLPLVLLLLPIWLIYSLFARGLSSGRMVFEMVPAFYCLLCATRGTELYVDNEESLVILKII